MRNLIAFTVYIVGVNAGTAEPPTPKERFLALNPDYKERAGAFYAAQYLPGTVRSMTSAIRSPGFRDADADRILRDVIGHFLDEYIQAGGRISRGNHAEVVARMDHEVRKLLGDDSAFKRYLAWRQPRNGVNNPLAFLLIVQELPMADAIQAKQPRRIRVLVADNAAAETPAVKRLRSLPFDVSVVAWTRIEPDKLKDIDVIFLATGWGEQSALAALDARKDAFRTFVRRGGGMVASQPNPSNTQTCSPALLPYPITFHYHYDRTDIARVNLAHDHFITEDLPDKDMPFPHDPIIQLDPRYRILAKQKSNDAPSLMVSPFGDGRVVVQTANESIGANIRLSDEILRRMIVWAAGQEPRRKAQ